VEGSEIYAAKTAIECRFLANSGRSSQPSEWSALRSKTGFTGPG
jgi:hypothetical protein